MAHRIGHSIIGMHLNAEGLCGRDKLDEQGEGFTVAFEIFCSHEGGTILADEGGQGRTEIIACGHDGFVARHARDFPAFANGLRAFGELLELIDIIASPDGIFEEGFKFDGFHIICQFQ